MTADHQTWVPHLRGVFVFAAKVGYHERKSADVLRTLNVVKGKDPRLLFHGFGWNNVHHPTAVNSPLIPPPKFHAPWTSSPLRHPELPSQHIFLPRAITLCEASGVEPFFCLKWPLHRRHRFCQDPLHQFDLIQFRLEVNRP
jgi:hypothetical protein